VALEDILVHVATPAATTAEEGEWIDGEQAIQDVQGRPFPCCLFLPQGAESGRSGREVKRPTMLYLAVYPDGSAIQIMRQDRLSVVAPELGVSTGLALGEPFRFQVDGDPQPLGRPGDDLVGFYAVLKSVDD
jgi:hypothetical protein